MVVYTIAWFIHTQVSVLCPYVLSYEIRMKTYATIQSIPVGVVQFQDSMSS